LCAATKRVARGWLLLPEQALAGGRAGRTAPKQARRLLCLRLAECAKCRCATRLLLSTEQAAARGGASCWGSAKWAGLLLAE